MLAQSFTAHMPLQLQIIKKRLDVCWNYISALQNLSLNKLMQLFMCTVKSGNLQLNVQQV